MNDENYETPIGEEYDGDNEEFCGCAECMDCEEPDDSMDGDFDSAMASAGLGTDEDYGYFGDD